MAKLWILGNSFSTNEDQGTWVKQIADSLNLSISNTSIGGVSLEYLYYDFNKIRNNIHKDDVVIIILGDLRRRWFLKDDPSNSIYKKITFNGRSSKKIENKHFLENTEIKVIKAINNYVDFLYKNTAIYEDYLLNFLHNLHYFSRKISSKIILLSVHSDVQDVVNKNVTSFPYLTFGEQCLTNISRNEFKPRELEKSGFLNFTLDLRLNHLINSNHKIMAEKMIKTITQNQPLDFHQGFITNFIDCNNLQDLKFSQKELFNAHLKPNYYEVISYFKDKLHQ